MSFWERFKEWFGKSWMGIIWNLIGRFIKWVSKPIALISILILVWYGFLKLVQVPPLDTTPILIMVWVTAFILILALFPSTLDFIRDNFKKLKIGDFEIELRDTVATSTPKDFISAVDIRGTTISANKGDARNLQQIISQVLQEANKPVLLTVNLEERISKSFLFVYLFLIELYADSSMVLFATKKSGVKDVNALKINEMVGVISGRELLHAYYRKFPSLVSIFGERNLGVNRVVEQVGLVQIPSAEFIEALYHICQRQISNDIEREDGRNRDLDRSTQRDLELLTKREVENWLKEKLDTKTIDVSLEQIDLENLREGLLQGDTFILISQDKKIKSIVRIGDLTRSISQKVLSQITSKN
jgi:hypothetical protein